ncbi:hypothetical protein D3C85_1934920 [compost metagenome]
MVGSRDNASIFVPVQTGIDHILPLGRQLLRRLPRDPAEFDTFDRRIDAGLLLETLRVRVRSL